MSDELKPCQKCGSSHVDYYHFNGSFNEYYAVECLDCKNRSEYNCHVRNTKEYAADVWNHRPTEDALREEIKMLRDALRSIQTSIFRNAGDTIWMMPEDSNETVCEFIDSALGENNCGKEEVE